MSNRSDRIPTFIKARSSQELRALFIPINMIGNEVYDYKIMQDLDTKEWVAWFYAFSNDILNIDVFIEGRKK